MLNIKNILLARDFSESSDAALRRALDLADRTGATLHAVFVEVLFEDVYAPIAKRGHLSALAQQLVEGLDAVPHEGVVLRDAAPAPALVAYAETHDIDVIVMGTHGRRGLRRLLLGSVAEEVVRTAPCPVLTVSAGAPQPFEAFLVPVDFSEHAKAALRQARALAALYDARLDLLHVVEDALHPAFYGYRVDSIYEFDPDIDRKALAELRGFYQEAGGPEVPVHFHVRAGLAAHEIAGFAEERGSSLIVMATHGLRGVEHFLLGSVAEKVVRTAPCPVFTVKTFVPEPALRPAEETALPEMPA